jgi:LmbE family N-acetylglucosaminyl deacetylase
MEFGCAGALSKCAAKGHDVFLLVLTKGERGGEPEVRAEEQMDSARLLGIKEVFWGGFDDTRMPPSEKVIGVVEDAVKRVAPRFVFVHHGKDTHQDHRHVNACAVVATRNVPNVLFYEGPTTFGFLPNVFIDIGEHIERKMASLECHKSQVMRTNIDNRSIIDIAKATVTFRGTECRLAYAEAFVSLRMLVL